MKQTKTFPAILCLALAGVFALGLPARAATITKANNTDDLILGSSWTGGTAPGSADKATFSSTITTDLVVNLGGNTNWNQLELLTGASKPGGNITINSGPGGPYTLKLGNNAPFSSVGNWDTNVTINCDLDLTGTLGTANFANKATLTFAGKITISGTITSFNMDNGSGLATSALQFSGQNEFNTQFGLARKQSLGIGASSVGSPITSGPLGKGLLYWNGDLGYRLYAYGANRTIGNTLQLASGNGINFDSDYDLTINGDVNSAANGRKYIVTNYFSSGAGVLKIMGNITNSGASGGLDKYGFGTLVLGGTNSYVGSMKIYQGRLILISGGASPLGTLEVTGGATNRVQVATADGQWRAKVINYSANLARQEFDFGSVAPSTTVAPLEAIGGNLSVSATTYISITGSNLSVGTFPLIKWSGTGPANTNNMNLTLPAGTSGYLAVDTVNKKVNLVLTAVSTALTGKLVITTPARTTTAGTSTAVITVERRDNSDAPVTSGSTVVTLSSTSATGKFRNAGDTADITEITIADGDSSADYCFQDTTVGIPTINNTASGQTAASQTVTVNPAAFAKLQLLVPGETAAPGTATGKTGTPSARSLGASFNVTVNGVDANWNLVNTVGDTVAITSTDGTATLPASAPLSGGTGSFSVTLNSTGNFTITATDSSDGGKSPDTSPAIAVSLPSGATIVWQGDNSLNQWNTSALNWTNTSGTPVAFANGDNAVFDDTGSVSPDVDITGSVLPTSVTVSNTIQNYTLGGSGKITYSTGLVKAGVASLTLTANNDFSGNVSLNGGTLRVGNGGTTGALGSGTVNVGGSGTVLAFNRSDSIVVNNRITGGSTTVPMIQAEAGTVTIGGTTDNSFAVATVKSGATMILAKASSGTVHALGNGATVETGGILKLGGTGGDQIFVWGDLIVDGLFDLNGLGETFDGLAGSGIVDNTGVAAVTMGVGADNNTTTFGGTIQNTGGNLAVTKSGNGTLTLTGTSSYGGATTVSSGSLLVNGTLNGVGNVAVNGSATLGGIGTISGAVNLTVNAKLAPGNAGVGTLTVNNNLTLAGSTLIELDKSLSPASDKINVTGALTYGGTLNVTNIGATALAGGDTFPIFPAGGSGSVSVVGDAGPGLSFSFSPATGVLSVLGAGGSPNLNYVVANNVITFSWTGAYKLIWQTNSLNVGLSNNWVDYPDASNPVNVTNNPAIKCAFFGLVPQ